MSRPRHTLEEQFYKVKRLQKNLMIKSTVCAVATLAAIAVTVSPVETGLKAQITAALAVIIWAACFKELSEGLISVFGGLPTNDTLNAYAMLAAFAQSIFAIFVPSSGKLYAWVVFVSCSCSAVMKYIYVLGILQNLEVIRKNRIYCVEDARVPLDKRYIDRACIAYRMRRIPNVVGKTYRNDACESAGFKYVPWVILASAVISVAAGLIYGRTAMFSTLVVSTGICAGFSGELSFVVPYNSAQKKLRELGCMIFGAFSIDRLKDVKTLIVRDKELFPSGCAGIADIKFIKAEFMSETVEYLALILGKIKSPLYPSMERYIFHADESLHSVENFKEIQDHGFSVTVDGREVLYGTRNLLLSAGIRPLPQEKEAEQTSKGLSTAYLVIDGNVAAVILAEYRADPKLKKAVERVGRDITVIVQTRDPLVTEATVQKRYSLTNAVISIATAEETEELNAVRRKLTVAKKTRPVMLSTKSALGTLSGIETAQILSSALETSIRIKQISVYAGLVLSAVAALAVPTLLNSVWVFVFNLIWTLPVIALSFRFFVK